MATSTTPPRRSNPAETSPASPGFVDVSFPPDDEGVSTLIGYCKEGELPVYFGNGISLEQYNKWLLNKEDGLRVAYDVGAKRVLLREGCYQSHGTTRLALSMAMMAAFAPHNYAGGFGTITTPVGVQDVTPDCFLQCGEAAYPVLAEVGVSQSEEHLNERAGMLLRTVPGARVIILVKVFDNEGPENGRMVAWCASRNPTGGLTLTGEVEFGRTGPGGEERVAWVAGTPAPAITVPIHDAVPATDVPLDGILSLLRGTGGAVNWKHLPPP